MMTICGMAFTPSSPTPPGDKKDFRRARRRFLKVFDMTNVNWSEIYNAFNPYDPVPLERIDDWFVARPHSPLNWLAVQLDPKKDVSRFLLVGHPASGKSTELIKLAAELKKRYEAFVVRVNLEENLDVEKCNPVEVIFLLGMAIHKVAAIELPDGKKPSEALRQDLEKALMTIVRTDAQKKTLDFSFTEILAGLVCAGAASVYAGPIGAYIVGQAAAKAMDPVRKFFRFSSTLTNEEVKKRQIEPKVKDLLVCLEKIIADVEEKADRNLILLVDGLDKPKRPDVIALNFEDQPYLSDVSCRIVYVAPIWIAYHSRFKGVRDRFAVCQFPNIKLHSRLNQENPDRTSDGWKIMRDVAYRRIRALGHAAPENVVPENVADRLIRGSAGVMRDFIRLVREAATEAEIDNANAITYHHAKKALLDLYNQLNGGLRPKHLEILQNVHQFHTLTDEECDDLVHGNLLLNYMNERDWWDSHAILWSEPWANE
jgi:hypothetical protein